MPISKLYYSYKLLKVILLCRGDALQHQQAHSMTFWGRWPPEIHSHDVYAYVML